MDDQKLTQLERLRELLSKPTLTPSEEQEKNSLLTYFKELGLTDEEIIPDSQLATSGIPNSALLSVLVSEYQESLSQQLENKLQPLNPKQRDKLLFLLLLNYHRKTTPILEQRLQENPLLDQALTQETSSKPELDAKKEALNIASDLVTLKEVSTDITLTPTQRDRAVTQIATDLISLSQITIPLPPQTLPPSLHDDQPPPLPSLEDIRQAPGTKTLSSLDSEPRMVQKPTLTPPEPELPTSQENETKSLSRNLTPLETAIIVDDVFASVTPKYTSTLHQLTKQLEDTLRPATDSDYLKYLDEQQTTIDSPQSSEEPLLFDPTTTFVIKEDTLDQILNNPQLLTALPTDQNSETKLLNDIVPPNYKNTPIEENHFLSEEIPDHQRHNLQLLKSLVTTSTLAPELTDLITPSSQTDKKLENIIVAEIRKEDHTLSPYPSTLASTAATLISHPQIRPLTDLDPTALKIIARLGNSRNTHQVSITKLVTTANKILAEKQTLLTSPEKKALINLVKGAKNINSNLFHELSLAQRPRILGRSSSFIDGFDLFLKSSQNRFVSLIPASQPFVSPLGYFRSQLGQRLGTSLSLEYLSNLSTPTLRRGLNLLNQKGFTVATQFLSQRAGRIAALKAATLTAPGGLLLTAALELGTQLLKYGGKITGEFSKAIWGEKVKKIDLLGAAGLAGGTIISGFVALGVGAQAALAAIFAAAGSAFITLFIAAAATLLFYISALNIAPILSTLVHLESGLGVGGTGGVSGIPEGLELKSCWPTDGTITQLNTSSHLVYTRLGSRGTALDIGASWGDPVYAPIDGTFTYYSMGTGPLTSGAGNYGIIEGSGITIGLLHLSGKASSGSQVRAGVDIVGYVGNTGNSFGPHLHYEIWGANIDLIVPRSPRLFMSVSHTECVDLVGSGGTGTKIPGEPAIDCPAESERITYPGATTNFLTNRTSQNGCITPQQLVIHWSGGEPYQTTASMTRDSLQRRGSGCAFAVDQNGVIQMMPLYSSSIQEGICSHQNNVSIDIEISGRCFSTDNSTCAGTTATPPESHPAQGAQFMNNIVNLSRWIMDQYDIPCSAIKGHFETAPGLRDDPGRSWLNNSLKPRLGC